MRDTFIALLVSFGIIGGYFYWKRDVSHIPSVAVSASSTSPEKVQDKKILNQGVKNESNRRTGIRKATARKSKRKSEGANPGIGEAPSEVEGLPSIYSSQKTGQQPESIESVLENDAARPEQAAAKPKNLHGVNVQAWLASKKNTMNTEVPDPKVGAGMRVFVNCLELKSKDGAAYSEKECTDLIAKSQKTRAVYY